MTVTPVDHEPYAESPTEAPIEPNTALPAPPAPAQRGRLARVLRWSAPAWALTPFIAAGWFVNRFNPTDTTPDPTGPCLWHAITGINGPTCGGTRMFHHLIHGNLVEAARHHLPALLAVPFLAYAWLAWTMSRFGVRLPALRLPRWALIAYGIFFVSFSTVLRNLDWGPLAWFDIPNLDPRTG